MNDASPPSPQGLSDAPKSRRRGGQTLVVREVRLPGPMHAGGRRRQPQLPVQHRQQGRHAEHGHVGHRRQGSVDVGAGSGERWLVLLVWGVLLFGGSYCLGCLGGGGGGAGQALHF